MKLDTVGKWWNKLRVRLSKDLAKRGIKVRPIFYDRSSEQEQEIVYDYWLDRQMGVRT